MRDAAEFMAREPELFAPSPIAPWDYIRLRREAAGLTIEQAARRFYAVDEHRAEVEANLRMFETANVRIKRVRDVDLSRAFPFDPEIYRQLAELGPDHHPQLCHRCGWDRWAAQIDLDGFDCVFAVGRTDLCTRCEQIEARGLRRAA